MRRAAPRVAPVAFVLLLALAHVVYLRFVCDDAFISYRYARNLVDGHGLVFNPGERVEGYTNFLWVLAAALVLRLGGAPEQVLPVVSAACALATLVVVMRFLDRRGRPSLWAGLLLATSAGFAAWATGGLETALFTLLVTLSVLLVWGAMDGPQSGAREATLLWSGVTLSLAALTRPEGVLVIGLVGAFLAVRAVRRTLPGRSLVAWGAVAATPVLIHVVWRLQYYGRFLPNTFYVKGAGAGHLASGLDYLAQAFQRLQLGILIVPVLALPLALRRGGLRERELALCGVVALPWLAWVAFSGGDFMDLFRFVVPVLPILAIVAGAGLAALSAGSPGRLPRPLGTAFAWAVVALWAAGNGVASWRSTQVWSARNLDSIGRLRAYAEDWKLVGEYLAATSKPSDTLATTAAGSIPYYSGLYAFDQLGLSVRDLSRFQASGSAARAGHGLIASGAWMNELNPRYLLGQPIAVGSPEELQVSPQLDSLWLGTIMARYHPALVQLSTYPPRFVAFAERNSLAAGGR